MERIRVTGAEDLTLDRDALERARAAATGAERSSSGPVCTAPFTTLVVDATGDARLCLGTAQNLQKRRPSDLGRAFRGVNANRLRAQLAANELPADHCARCVHGIGLDLAAHAPLIRDHATADDTAEPRLRRLIVRLDRGPDRSDEVGLLRRIGTVAAELERIDIHVVDPSTDSLFGALIESLKSRPRPPRLHLRIQRVSAAARLREMLTGLSIAGLTIDADGDLEAALTACRRHLAASVRPTVVYVPGPTNWFDVHRFAEACVAFDVMARLNATDVDGRTPLLELPLAEQRFVVGLYGSLWRSFAGPLRPLSVGPDEFDLLRAELRRSIGDEVLLGDSRTAQQILDGTASLAPPPLEHPMLTDPSLAATLFGWLTGVESTATVADWADVLGPQPGFEVAASERPWLRLLLLNAAIRRPSDSTFAVLRRLYPREDARLRERRHAEDAEFADRAGVRSAVDVWHAWLGIDRLGARAAPWPSSTPLPEVGDGTPDVTVLIPSYRHQAFVEDCVRSALHQSHRWLVVHVVDDGSPDDTVEHARAIGDPRLSVRVNSRNLGLANSVLDALEHVTTPFVALLNSDDLFHPDRIARCRQALIDDQDAQLVTTGLVLIDEDGGEITTSNVNRLTDGRQVFDWVHWYERAQPSELDNASLFAELLEHNFLATSSNLFCRTDFLRAQAEGLRSLKFCLDWHLFLEATRQGVLRHLPERLAAYRLHRGNTVWFHEGRRWSYYLEVNRVAAQALRSYVADSPSAAGRERALALAAERLANNTEADGICAFVNELLGGVELGRLSERSKSARQAIETLNARAERITRLGYATREIPESDLERELRTLARRAALEVASLALGVVREEADFSRGSARWARNAHADLTDRLHLVERALEDHRTRERATAELLRQTLERADPLAGRLIDALGAPAEASRRPGEDPIDWLERIVPLWLDASRERIGRLAQKRQRIDTLEKERDAALQRVAELETQRIAADARIAELRLSQGDLTARVGELGARLASERQRTTELEQTIVDERSKTAGLTARIDELRSRLASESDALRAANSAHDRTRSQLEQTKDRIASHQRDRQIIRDAERLLRSTAEDLDGARTRLAPFLTADASSSIPPLADEEKQGPAAGLHRTRLAIERARDDLRRSRAEIERMRRSIEWRLGWFLWRKLPLFAKSRRVLRAAYRRGREAGTRSMMFLKRLFGGRKRPQLKIAAGSTAEFPIISHTFVYQELTAMHEMLGADIKVFHSQPGKPENAHAAFAYLQQNLEHVQPAWEVHKADFEHYRRISPEKVESLLNALAENSDVPRDELENRFELMMAFTFARRHALWGANYVHSYFFYDQALCALVSSWMNDLPRGLSTYADHMMKDWPLKVTALHLRTADVIVATSRRIRDELIGIGGPGIADKVIVKPNGVDGTRFKFVSRTPVQDRPIELVCVSRIEPKKGMIELAEAAAILKQQGRAFRIHVVGSADFGSEASERYAERFERRIAELGVDEFVVRHGRMTQDQLQPLLVKADAFLAPFVETESGDKDGIPTAILEAIATGLPVITTDAGSIPEIIDDGVEGFLVRQRDPSALARAIERLIDDPGLAPRLGKAAKQRFDREFDIRATEPRLHQRILKAVALRKPAAV